MPEQDFSNRAWAILFARLILGLIFFMAGMWKVFTLGPLEHARRLFVDPYAHTFLPRWSLWAAGTVVPFVELTAGALLLVGLRTRDALLALGGVLVLVTFGHLLAEPLYEFHTHVIPAHGACAVCPHAAAGRGLVFGGCVVEAPTCGEQMSRSVPVSLRAAQTGSPWQRLKVRNQR